MMLGSLSMSAALFALTYSVVGVTQTLAAPGDSCGEAISFCPQNSAECIFDLSVADEGIYTSNEDGVDMTVDGLWFKFTVDLSVTTCVIQLHFDTCAGAGGFDSDLLVYESCPSTTGPTVTPSWQDLESCNNGEDADLKIDNLSLVEGTKDFYVLLKPADGTSVSTVFGGSSYSIQGNISWRTGACGDPHFYRWNHAVRDSFHGECDMVLMHKENIAEGMDLDVHIRTTIRDSYSYIEAAAVKFGPDRVEFQMNGVYVNGEKKEDDEFPLNVGIGNQIVKDLTSTKPKYAVKIAGKVAVEIKSTKQFMAVMIAGNKGGLDGSLGMLGDHVTGDMVARDGSVFPEGEFEQFAFEWQVHPTDPQIFMHAREPQLPYERCRMPSMSAESRRRKLRGQDRKLYEQAVAACTENHIAENVQSCVDDVMFTGDLELAGDLF